MLLISLADIITSLAIASTTLPMPKDVIYPFETPSYGTAASCNAQGLIYLFGNGFLFMVNGILHIYYLLRLRFGMDDLIFSFRVEPILCLLSLGISIGLTIGAFNKGDIINPSPTDPFCVPYSYPMNCTKETNPDCRGESGSNRGSFDLLYRVTLGSSFCTIVIIMGLLVDKFYRMKRKMERIINDKSKEEESQTSASSEQNHEALIQAVEQYKIVTFQAGLYITAFFFTYAFSAIEHFRYIKGYVGDNTTLGILRMIFQPLQGVFNLIIFVIQKIFAIRVCDPDIGLDEALRIVFFIPRAMDDQALVSNIDVMFLDKPTDIKESSETPAFMDQYPDIDIGPEDPVSRNVSGSLEMFPSGCDSRNASLSLGQYGLSNISGSIEVQSNCQSGNDLLSYESPIRESIGQSMNDVSLESSFVQESAASIVTPVRTGRSSYNNEVQDAFKNNDTGKARHRI